MRMYQIASELIGKESKISYIVIDESVIEKVKKDQDFKTEIIITKIPDSLKRKLEEMYDVLIIDEDPKKAACILNFDIIPNIPEEFVVSRREGWFEHCDGHYSLQRYDSKDDDALDKYLLLGAMVFEEEIKIFIDMLSPSGGRGVAR